MKKDDIKKMSPDELKKELSSLRKEVFNLRLSVSSGEVKDYSQFKKLRADIARCLTFLNQRRDI